MAATGGSSWSSLRRRLPGRSRPSVSGALRRATRTPKARPSRSFGGGFQVVPAGEAVVRRNRRHPRRRDVLGISRVCLLQGNGPAPAETVGRVPLPAPRLRQAGSRGAERNDAGSGDPAYKTADVGRLPSRGAAASPGPPRPVSGPGHNAAVGRARGPGGLSVVQRHSRRQAVSSGGNVLTGPVLAQLPPHAGPKVIYAAACRLGRARLDAERITFKQTPYDLQV